MELLELPEAGAYNVRQHVWHVSTTEMLLFTTSKANAHAFDVWPFASELSLLDDMWSCHNADLFECHLSRFQFEGSVFGVVVFVLEIPGTAICH